MSIEKLKDRDRILLWDITGKHDASARYCAVGKALRIINQLTEALAAAESERDTYATALANADDSKSRVRELEADIERYSHGKLATQLDAAEARVRELEAALTASLEHTNASEKQLAATNALLEAATTFIPEELWPVWERTKAAHLSAKPALPTEGATNESKREVCMVRPVDGCVLGPQSASPVRVPAADAAGHVQQVAAPTDHDRADTWEERADTWEERAHQAEALDADMVEQCRRLRAELDAAWKATRSPVRGMVSLAEVIEAKTPTDHDRAVLEAMGKARRASLVDLAALPEGTVYHSVGRACLAELARREEK